MNKLPLLLYIGLYLVPNFSTSFQQIIKDVEQISQTDSYPYCILHDGRLGECKSIKNCSYALDLLRKHKVPKLCKFDEQDPTVCCLPTPIEFKQGSRAVHHPILKSNYCTLPNGKPGECKNIKNCSYAVNLLRESKRPTLCRFDSGDPIVCCLPTLKIEKSESRFGKTTTGGHCVLSDGKSGICKNIQNCTYAINLLKEKKRPQVCGFDGRDPVVCCLSTLTLKLRKQREPGDISSKKCREFRRPYLTMEDLKSDRYAVFNGNGTRLGQYPHMAAIGFDYENKIEWSCGGTLISEKFVLTAAHCLNSRFLGPAKYIRVGVWDLLDETDIENYQTVLIKQRIPHPNYVPPSIYHDIALLELETSIKRTADINMACLYKYRVYNRTSATVTGWGKVDTSGPPSNILLQGFLKVLPHDECEDVYKRKRGTTRLLNGIIDDIIICAGGESDTCEGDSGGPLGYWRMGNITSRIPDESDIRTIFSVVGVTSSGKPCGIGKKAGIYTRVAHYIEWIENIVWPDE